MMTLILQQLLTVVAMIVLGLLIIIALLNVGTAGYKGIQREEHDDYD